MTKETFLNMSRERILYLDGATGSNLIQRGMPTGVCPEKWIADHPHALIQLQREFVEAGSDIVYAPTFGANRIKLAEYGLEDQIGELNRRLVSISKEAVGNRALVAADLTMTGHPLKPVGDMEFETLISIYKEQIGYCVEAGADLIVVETMMSLQESRAALIAAKECCDLPVMVTMTFEEDGKSLFGTNAETAAIVLESLGAAAIGANCSTGPDKMGNLIRDMAKVTTIPIIAKPNAGLPALDSKGNTIYDMDAVTFGREMKQLVEAGAQILGGCCGTTPVFISELAKSTADLPVRVRTRRSDRFLTSERQTLAFGLEDPFIIVGERINPTGKKKLQTELREGKLDMVGRFALEQDENGASLLDINVGMSGIDEEDMMLKILEEVEGITQLPLSIDSSHAKVIETALRRYPGRALINSISMETAKFENLLPVAAKYGAMFILLPVSDEGLPGSVEERIEIIEKIYARAQDFGLTREDIVVDGLVGTVGADPKAAMDTINTIRYCKEHGFATTCGLSNISFGLPERSFVNTAFLTMAIQAGLTMAIANPSQHMLVNCARATDLLMHKEGADIRYIEGISSWKEANPEGMALSATQKTVGKAGSSATQTAVSTEERDTLPPVLSAVRDAVLKGNKRTIVELTKEALASAFQPREVLDRALLPGINDVGDLFDKGKYFLPQLISGAEAMKLAIEYLEPLLMEGGEEKRLPTIVIATVKGDIHDIGKNLVALMLKNYGFRVIDLGKDVPRETIVEEAKKNNAGIIALSALMTTTMQEMRHVISYAKQQGVAAKVIVGGAVITQEYADEIGADGYSRDAAEAVRLAQRVLGL